MPPELLPGKLLYITSNADVVHRRALDWRYKFGEVLKQRVVELCGDGTTDAAAEVATASIVLASGEQLIRLVRSGDPVLAGVTHIVVDHLHLLRAPEGQAMEECVARLNSEPYLVRRGAGRARVLGLTYPLISTAELGRWLKVSASHQYNYGASYRQLRVRMMGMELPGPRSRFESGVVAALKLLRRPSYAAVPTVVFVPTARQAREVAQRVLLRCRDNCIPETTTYVTDDARLAVYMATGVAYLHAGTSELDALAMQELVDAPALHPTTQAPLPLCLVCAFDAAWRLPAALFTNAMVCCGERLTAFTGEDGERGMVHRDCSAVELMQMASRAMNEAVLCCRAARVWVWGKLLNEPLPLESGLRYADDFRDSVNAAVAQGRAHNRIDVLRVLSSHYFLYHVKSNLHFYGVPTAADVSAYASSFASHVVNSLKELRCIEELRMRSRGDDGASAEGAAEEEGEEGADEDPHAPLRPTVRGMALAHHCIAVSTAEELVQVLPGSLEAERKKAALYDSTTCLWQTLAHHCAELSPAQLGDAARVTEAAEYRALHSLARALPDSLGVRYIDLDFSAPGTKVYLLVLAYCTRLFPADGGDDASAGAEGGSGAAAAQGSRAAAFDAHYGHPLYHAAVDPSTRDALCGAVSADVARRLAQDVRAVLPAVRRVVSAIVELLDGETQAWAVVRLVRFVACLWQQEWTGNLAGGGGDAAGTAAANTAAVVTQLPCWRAARWASLPVRDALQAACTLPELQSDPAAGAAKIASALRAVVGVDEDAAVSAVVAAAVQDAARVPLVASVSAVGRVEEMDGVLAMVVRVTAELRWCGPSASAQAFDAAAAAAAGQWWVRCVMTPRASPSSSAAVPTRQLALRVSSATPSAPAMAAASSTYSVVSDVFFPIARLEAEDLDAVELRAVLTCVAYCGVEASAVVQFESGDEEAAAEA